MPKPMLGQSKLNNQTNMVLNVSQNKQQSRQDNQIDKLKVDRLLRKSRSKEYMES